MNDNNINQQQTVIEKPSFSENVPPVFNTSEEPKKTNNFQIVMEKIKNIWLGTPEKTRKILKIVVYSFGFFIFLITILFIVSKFMVKNSAESTFLPPASFEPLPTGDMVTNPSRYATDSGILEIEKNLINLEKELDTMQVNETNLLPPKLDFDINFNQ